MMNSIIAGIMIYKSFPGLNHDTAKLIHLILHTIAIVLGAVGIYCAFKNHNESGIANLYSLHSWLGLGAISLYGIQWIFGFVTFFYPGAAPDVRRSALPWHALFGLFVYILTLATSQLGFLEKLTFLESGGLDKYGTEAILVNCTALVVVLFGTAVVVAAISPADKVDEPEGYAPIPVVG
jgi:cytochrome b-561